MKPKAEKHAPVLPNCRALDRAARARPAGERPSRWRAAISVLKAGPACGSSARTATGGCAHGARHRGFEKAVVDLVGQLAPDLPRCQPPRAIGTLNERAAKRMQRHARGDGGAGGTRGCGRSAGPCPAGTRCRSEPASSVARRWGRAGGRTALAERPSPSRRSARKLDACRNPLPPDCPGPRRGCGSRKGS